MQDAVDEDDTMSGHKRGSFDSSDDGEEPPPQRRPRTMMAAKVVPMLTRREAASVQSILECVGVPLPPPLCRGVATMDAMQLQRTGIVMMALDELSTG